MSDLRAASDHCNAGLWVVLDPGFRGGHRVCEPSVPHDRMTQSMPWITGLDADSLVVDGAEFGRFTNADAHDGPPCLRLDTQQVPQHAWAQARIDVPVPTGHVFGDLRMQRLQPNGTYFNVALGRAEGDAEGLVEIKFDHATLRGYDGGSAPCTPEDFGVAVPTVRAGEWVKLDVLLEAEGQALVIAVNGTATKVMALQNGPWRCVTAVVLRGYAKGGVQWYRGVGAAGPQDRHRAVAGLQELLAADRDARAAAARRAARPLAAFVASPYARAQPPGDGPQAPPAAPVPWEAIPWVRWQDPEWRSSRFAGLVCGLLCKCCGCNPQTFGHPLLRF